MILIVVDCLRADHLSLYGYGRKTSPRIDSFAGEAVVFRRAAAQANSTSLSFASIFTSRNVAAHGLDGSSKSLSDSALTLAEILKIYGYRTAAFVGAHLLSPVYRLDQGFELYSHVNRLDIAFKDTLPPALAWAKERAAEKKKFFLVVHGNELHAPYTFPESSLYTGGYAVRPGFMAGGAFSTIHKRTWRKRTGPPVPLSDDEVNYIVARYDEGINYADAAIGEFLDGLREAELLESSVVVLTSDHGEGLFDHDFFFHSLNLYEDTLHVPLVIRVPATGRRDIYRQVQLIDLMPTVLELAGIAPPAAAQGRSLVPLLRGEEPAHGFDRDIFSQSGRGGGAAIRSGKWKLIRSLKRTELFDLEKDPGERADLAGAERALAEELGRRLSVRLAEDAKNSPPLK